MAPAQRREPASSRARLAPGAASSPISRDFSPSPALAPPARARAKSSRSAAPSAAGKDASRRNEPSTCVFHPAGIPERACASKAKAIEQRGAWLKVDKKPAERGSSLFDKVKDIFG